MGKGSPYVETEMGCGPVGQSTAWADMPWKTGGKGNCWHGITADRDPFSLLFPLSGGLLICLPREQAARFCAEIKSPKYGEGHQAWIIGIVEKGNRTARIIDKPRIIEVAPQVATQNVNPTPGATS